MRVKVHSYFMLFSGLLLFAIGIYSLIQYIERKEIIANYGYDAIHDEKITSAARGCVIVAF